MWRKQVSASHPDFSDPEQIILRRMTLFFPDWPERGHLHEDENLAEERSKKQPTVYVNLTELSHMFDKILLFGLPGENHICFLHEIFQKEPSQASSSHKDEQHAHASEPRGQKQAGSGNSYVKEIPDLRTLLLSCAQIIEGMSNYQDWLGNILHRLLFTFSDLRVNNWLIDDLVHLKFSKNELVSYVTITNLLYSGFVI